MALKKDSGSLIQAVLEKSWEELEALEYQDQLLFPFDIKRRRLKDWESIPVLLKVPREVDLRKARIRARAWAKEAKLDPDLDPLMFDNMDSMCVLADAIRNVEAPHEPWEPFPEKLESLYDRPSLDAVWAQLEALKTVIDPRPDLLTEEQLLTVIGAVAKARNIVPLAAFAGESQNNCVVTMAVRLKGFLESK